MPSATSKIGKSESSIDGRPSRERVSFSPPSASVRMPSVVVNPLMGIWFNARATFKPIRIRPMPIQPAPWGREVTSPRSESATPHQIKNSPHAIVSKLRFVEICLFSIFLPLRLGGRRPSHELHPHPSSAVVASGMAWFRFAANLSILADAPFLTLFPISIASAISCSLIPSRKAWVVLICRHG